MRNRDIVVIAGSAGSLPALAVILPALPAQLPATLFVVVHIGTHKGMLPQTLARGSALPVREALDATPIETSTIYVAPADRHLVVHDGLISLTSGPRENFTRPAGDVLFRSAALAYGARAVGVVLSGALGDGAAGLRAIKTCGGVALVQEPNDCLCASMPVSALRIVEADVVAAANRLGPLIVRAVMGEPAMRIDQDDDGAHGHRAC